MPTKSTTGFLSLETRAQNPRIRSTTVLCVRRKNRVVMAGDGQVTLGDHVIKQGARKIRRLYEGKILAGFAGSTADAFSLFARFETKLEQYAGNLGRSAVELAKDWRTDKSLRQLEALLLVADQSQTYLLSGNGDVIEPDDDIAAIGSGGRADAVYRSGRAEDCGSGDDHCRTDLHLYQREVYDRRALIAAAGRACTQQSWRRGSYRRAGRGGSSGAERNCNGDLPTTDGGGRVGRARRVDAARDCGRVG